MSDIDDRNNEGDSPDTDDDENVNDNDQDVDGGDGPADDSMPARGAAPDPGESGRSDTTRMRSTL